MLLLTCPNCGVAADETELAPGGEAQSDARRVRGRTTTPSRAICSIARTPRACISSAGATPTAAASGSIAARCTVTLEVFGTYPAQVLEPAAGDPRRDPRQAARLDLGEPGMSARLSTGGRLIDRAARRSSSPSTASGCAGVRGRHARLGASGQRRRCWSAGRSSITARAASWRPAPEEPNALVGLGRDRALRAQRRAPRRPSCSRGWRREARTTGPASSSTWARSTRFCPRFLPAGFYYKMFLHPRSFWKHVYEPFIRQSAGPGAAAAPPRCRHLRALPCPCRRPGRGRRHRGPGRRAGRGQGRRPGAADRADRPLGRARRATRATIDGQDAAADWVDATVADLDAMPNVSTCASARWARASTTTAMSWRSERLTDHDPDRAGPRQRLWKVRAGQVVTATGAIERPLSFAGNDIPGVMLASAVRDYVVDYGVSPGDRTVVVTEQRRRLPHRAGAEGGGARGAGGRRCPRTRRRARFPRRRARAGHPRPDRARRRQGQGRGPGRRRDDLRRRGRGRGARGDRLRRGRHVGRLVAGRAPVVPLRRQAGLGRGSRRCSGRTPTSAPTGADGQPFVRAAGTADGHLVHRRLPVERPPGRARGGEGHRPRQARAGHAQGRSRAGRSDPAGLDHACRCRARRCGRRCGSTSRTT